MEIKVKWLYRLGFLLLLFVVVHLFMKLAPYWLPVIKIIFAVLTPFVISAFITYLLHPVIEKLHATGLHRGISVMIIYLLFFGGIGIALYKGIPVFIMQLRELTENAPQLAEQYSGIIQFIEKKTAAWPDGIRTKIEGGIAGIEDRLDQLFNKVVNLARKMLNYLIILALIPFITFYMLKDINLMKKAAWYLTPKKWRQGGRLFLNDADESLGGYIRGQLLVCTIIGVLSSLAFWMIGMQYPLLLGMITGITNVIPYFGPIIALIPAIIIASAISGKTVVFCIVISIVLQFIEANILSPLIVGKSLHMHPLAIMLALLAGEEIAGLPGLILSVPVFAVLKVAMAHYQKYIHNKNHVKRA
ncbi:AI-2E family transporter [Bacillaceae bacterium Marseille-Q3522]|nr:AI-2E family transporter [Bacillaceae bacterium Marseille-Q3522]